MTKYKTRKQKENCAIVKTGPDLCNVENKTLHEKLSPAQEPGLLMKIFAIAFLGTPAAIFVVGGIERLFADRPQVVSDNGFTFSILFLLGFACFAAFPGFRKAARDGLGGQ